MWDFNSFQFIYILIYIIHLSDNIGAVGKATSAIHYAAAKQISAVAALSPCYR